MNKPQFITFTGADDKTSVKDMVSLAKDYPVEFGILFSVKRVGTPRYPTCVWVDLARERFEEIRLAAHLCGQYARSVIENSRLTPCLSLAGFRRVQINTAARNVDPFAVGKWASGRGMYAILQCRTLSFPNDRYVSWLYDCSGGRGEEPPAWAVPPVDGRLVGYAGGINPGNVLDVLKAIDNNGPYWIDMESGVRDENDQFSIELCRKVCELVYGAK